MRPRRLWDSDRKRKISQWSWRSDGFDKARVCDESPKHKSDPAVGQEQDPRGEGSSDAGGQGDVSSRASNDRGSMMPRRMSDGRAGGPRSSMDDEELEATSGAGDDLDLLREGRAAVEREAIRLAERDAAEKALEMTRRELEVAVAERDRAVAAAQRDEQTLLGLQARVADIERRAVSADGALLAAADRVQELKQLVANEDRELEDQSLVLEELDRQVEAAREREHVRLAELEAAQVERDRAVGAARSDAQALLGFQARIAEIDRWETSVDDELLAAAGRLQELEQVVRDGDESLEIGRLVLEELSRQLDAARERDDLQLVELRAMLSEREAAQQPAETRLGLRDEHAAARGEAGDSVAQLQRRTSELQQRVDGMNSSLSSALELAAGLEESAHEASDETARLQDEIEALTRHVERLEETGTSGDPGQSGGIEALLDELRRLLANAVMQAEAAAEERTRLERELKLLGGTSEEGSSPVRAVDPQRGDPPLRDPPG